MKIDIVRPLRRHEAAEYCSARGYPVARNTLAKLAVVGGGPEFRRFGRLPLYEPAALDRWIASKLSEPLGSTSEAAA